MRNIYVFNGNIRKTSRECCGCNEFSSVGEYLHNGHVVGSPRSILCVPLDASTPFVPVDVIYSPDMPTTIQQMQMCPLPFYAFTVH